MSRYDKNKVCVLTSVHSPFDGRIFYKECRSLAKSGYEVYLVATYNREEIIDGVHIMPLPQIKSKFYRFFAKDWIALYKAIRVDAKICHFHDPELIIVGIVLKLFGKKVIYDVHEDYPEIMRANLFMPKNIRFIVSYFMNFWEKTLSRIFDALIFPTEGLSEKFINKRKVILVNFPLKEKSPASLDNNSKKGYDIIHLGTISPFRMIFFVKVMQELEEMKKDYEWLFLGISKETVKWCNKNIHPALIKHIIFKERIPYNRALELMSSAIIGINYHPYEERFRVAIPIKIFEYMAFGLPVITTALPELVRYLGVFDGEFGFLLDDNNPQVFAKKITQILENPDKEKMGKKGMSLFLEKFNWETREALKLINLYKEIING